MKCPVCAADATGKFCASCGATLATVRCPSCNAEHKPGSRFCNLCGHSLGTGEPDRGMRRWIIAGGSLAVLAVVLLVRMTASSTTGAGTGAGVVAPDISNMTPRERADRLFNRVMAASERGDSGEVAFFGSMALQAYGLIGGLDADARYHVGMMHLALRDSRSARAQADSITRSDRNHLMASLLRAEIAERSGDAAARNRAWREFLAHYDAEMATSKPEYGDHRTALENARAAARQAISGGVP